MTFCPQGDVWEFGFAENLSSYNSPLFFQRSVCAGPEPAAETKLSHARPAHWSYSIWQIVCLSLPWRCDGPAVSSSCARHWAQLCGQRMVTSREKDLLEQSSRPVAVPTMKASLGRLGPGAGTEAPMMAEAAVYNIERGAQIIDINMGCPARRSATNGRVPP